MGVLIRELGALYGAVRRRAPLAPAGAAAPVCRLRDLAAGMALRRGAGDPARLVARAARRGTGDPRSPPRPAAAGPRQPPRRERAGRPPGRSEPGAREARRSAGRDPFHGAAHRLRGPPLPGERPGEGGYRLARRQPHPPGERRADRVLRQHPAPARRPGGRSGLGGAFGPGAADGARRLRPPGCPFREAGRGARARAQPCLVAALPGDAGAPERAVAAARPAGPRRRAGGARQPDGEVRPHPRARPARRGDGRGPLLQRRSVRADDGDAARGWVRGAAGRGDRGAGAAGLGAAAPDRSATGPAPQRVERHRWGGGRAGPRALRRPGPAAARGDGGHRPGRAADLLRARGPRRPARPAPARSRRRAGGAGGDLYRGLAVAGGGGPRRPSGGRRLHPPRSGLPAGAPGLRPGGRPAAGDPDRARARRRPPGLAGHGRLPRRGERGGRGGRRQGRCRSRCRPSTRTTSPM